MTTELVQELIGEAVETTNSGAANVLFEYAGHVNALFLYAHEPTAIYDGRHRNERLINYIIYLDRYDATEQLQNAIKAVRNLRREAAA